MAERRIALTSGHRQSIGIAYDNGRIVGPTRGQSLSHHSVSFADITNRLSGHLSNLSDLVGTYSVASLASSCESLILCLPGGATSADSDMGRRALEAAGWTEPLRATVVDDTWAGAVAGADDGKAVCCIAGTGASVFVSDGDFGRGRGSKIDGWGPLLGDHGSRFDLGVKTLSHICRELDRRGDSTLLNCLMEEVPRLKELIDVQQWLDTVLRRGHSIWRLDIAEIGSIVVRLAESDPSQFHEAVTLINHAAVSFGETVSVALRRSPSSRNMPILGYGEMVERSSFFRQRLSLGLEAEFDQPFQVRQYTVPYGCLLMAWNPVTFLPRADERRLVKDAVERSSDTIKSVLIRSIAR